MSVSVSMSMTMTTSMTGPDRVMKEPVRFDSFRFRSFRTIFCSVRFGSVRTNKFPGSTRLGLRFSDAPWLGPVRFGSVSVSGIDRFCSVRFGRFGSVSYSFLWSCFEYMWPRQIPWGSHPVNCHALRLGRGQEQTHAEGCLKLSDRAPCRVNPARILDCKNGFLIYALIPSMLLCSMISSMLVFSIIELFRSGKRKADRSMAAMQCLMQARCVESMTNH